MSLMFSRRRQEAARKIEAEKRKAHAENHAQAQAKACEPEAKKAAHGATDKPRTK